MRRAGNEKERCPFDAQRKVSALLQQHSSKSAKER
jgi:hypothetical protein